MYIRWKYKSKGTEPALFQEFVEWIIYNINSNIFYFDKKDFLNCRQPWVWSDFTYGLTEAGREHARLCDYVHAFAEEIIYRRRQSLVGLSWNWSLFELLVYCRFHSVQTISRLAGNFLNHRQSVETRRPRPYWAGQDWTSDIIGVQPLYIGSTTTMSIEPRVTYFILNWYIL